MPSHPPQRRFTDLVMSRRVCGLDSFAGEVAVEPWMITELRAAEASIRRLRRQMEERLASEPGRVCAGCGRPFSGARPDARYCSGRCRQAALRSRQGDG